MKSQPPPSFAPQPDELWTPEPGPTDIAFRSGPELIVLSLFSGVLLTPDCRELDETWFGRVGNRVLCRSLQQRFLAVVAVLEHTPSARFIPGAL